MNVNPAHEHDILNVLLWTPIIWLVRRMFYDIDICSEGIIEMNNRIEPRITLYVKELNINNIVIGPMLWCELVHSHE